MKIALIIPKVSSDGGRSFYEYRFLKNFLMSKKYFSYLLAIPVLSSLTPSEHEIRVFDENIEEIDYTWDADLAGITARTMFAKRAYKISDNFRKRGVKTVLGGIHPSMCTEEALQFCDTVVVGEAEHVWHSLLSDARNGGMKRIYKAEEKADLTSFPVSDRSCLSKEKYITDIVQTTKGCPFNCEFCSVYAFDGQGIRNRTIDQVLEEIQEISGTENRYKKKSIFFADDNIIANRKFARELFVALKQYNLNWSCQASINISRDDEILRLMKESGCGAILIGLESISEDNLASMHKNVNLRHDYVSAIKKIQSYGIMVHSSFIVGYDFDTQSSLDELAEFIEEADLIMPLINVLTPLPGTKLFDRFEREGRLLHKDWDKYDGVTVVFKPKLMIPEELEEGHSKIIQKVYSFDSIYRKLKHYWDIDFWKHSNEVDPIKFKLRLLFALRLVSLLASGNIARSKFILKILPKVFQKRVRISTILTLMAYNDFAYSL
jgi:radical SAM superfamily enzyme YgiQ (UPF0313 family)